MRYLGLLLLISGCMSKIEVPETIHHEASGTVTQVIKIEIVLPEALLTNYTTECQTYCASINDTSQSCMDTCTASKQQGYVDTIMNLISQFQASQPSSQSDNNQ